LYCVVSSKAFRSTESNKAFSCQQLRQLTEQRVHQCLENVFHCVGDSVTTVVARRGETKDIRLDKPEKSSVAEHSIETGHGIDFSGTPLSDLKIRTNQPLRTASNSDANVNEQLSHRQWFHIKPGLVPCNQLFNQDAGPSRASS
jgi:hypothetical protein